MAKITYKGESYGKKVARVFYWLNVRALLGDRFLAGKHLVLASQEGGDISVLKALGVPVGNIHAAEINADAAELCRTRHPDVEIVVDDVAEVARLHRKSLASVLLDFCGPLSEFVSRIIFRVAAHGLPHDSVLGIAVMRGREQGAIRQALYSSRAWLDELMEEIDGAVDLTDHTRDMAQSLDRHMVLTSGLHDRLVRLRIYPDFVCQTPYHSRGTTNGVPMVYLMYSIFRDSHGGAKSSFLRRVQRSHAPNCVWPLRRMIRTDRESLARSQAIVGAPSLPIMLEVARRSGVSDIAGLLNVSPPRLAAWRAHAARGTYRSISNGEYWDALHPNLARARAKYEAMEGEGAYDKIPSGAIIPSADERMAWWTCEGGDA